MYVLNPEATGFLFDSIDSVLLPELNNFGLYLNVVLGTADFLGAGFVILGTGFAALVLSNRDRDVIFLIFGATRLFDEFVSFLADSSPRFGPIGVLASSVLLDFRLNSNAAALKWAVVRDLMRLVVMRAFGFFVTIAERGLVLRAFDAIRPAVGLFSFDERVALGRRVGCVDARLSLVVGIGRVVFVASDFFTSDFFASDLLETSAVRLVSIGCLVFSGIFEVFLPETEKRDPLGIARRPEIEPVPSLRGFFGGSFDLIATFETTVLNFPVKQSQGSTCTVNVNYSMRRVLK